MQISLVELENSLYKCESCGVQILFIYFIFILFPEIVNSLEHYYSRIMERSVELEL
jgi:hypothetical protein